MYCFYLPSTLYGSLFVGHVHVHLTSFVDPLSQPDLADGEDDLINQDIVELQKELYQQVMFHMCYTFWMSLIFQILLYLTTFKQKVKDVVCLLQIIRIGLQ
jgi:hypothetical protein